MLAEGTDSKGRIVALPKGAYAQALHYNRKLFAQAGLDPNKPPTTWAEVAADAKQIAQKTGKAGYVEMGKDDNTAGWILTTLVYSLGGRMESGSGTKADGDAQQPADRARRSTCCTQMRWTDNSMGSNFDYGWSDINQAFAAGQRRHVHQRLGRLHEPRAGQQHRPEHLRPRADSAREEQERRRARRRHARRGAAERQRRRAGRGA